MKESIRSRSDRRVGSWAVAFPEWIETRRDGKWYRVVKYAPLVIPQPESVATLAAREAEKQQEADAWAAWGGDDEIPF